MATQVFLFTDIEGSTRLWSDVTDLMSKALAVHDGILVSAIEDAGGAIFKHTGDGVCATFPFVSEAISAAVAAQRGLIARAWGAIGQLEVRMAVHVGEAAQRDGDWFGPGLNRAARLMGIAHGGQILVSAAAMDLARDSGSLQYDVVDLGVHRLRDLASPEHVCQVVADGLGRVFPPLRSLGGFRGNLPSQLTSFLGRVDELDAIVAEALRVRLVTLVGPGGVGKTRLALQAAAAMVEMFPDGVWVLELAPLSDPGAVEHALASTIGLVSRGGLSPAELAVQVLRDWRALIVLDNCEHLLEPAGLLARRILSAAADVVILATSREPLHVLGESVWVVPPLPVDGIAAELFLERASAVLGSFAAEFAPDVVRTICGRLDGMPLAIELAAARMRSMTASELLARLDHRFRLLALGKGGERHSSLQAALDWSFDLLGQTERAFFSRLSVFASGFDLEAAHAVTALGSGDELTTLDLLDVLVNKSLVVATEHRGRTRYSLLETMRQYGADHFAADEALQLGQRHAQYFTEFAEQAWSGMRGPDDVGWVTRVEENFDNLRAALQWALSQRDVDTALRIVTSLEPFNHTRRKPEIWAWARSAIALPAAESHTLVARAYLVLAFGGHAQDDPLESEHWARRAAERHQTLKLPPDPRLGILLVYGLAYQGRVEEAAHAASEAVTLAAALGASAAYDRVEALYQLGFMRMMAGTPDIALGESCLDLAREIGNTWLQARACLTLGLALGTVDPDRGRDLLEEAVALCRRPAYPFWVGSTLLMVATAYADTDPAEGLRRLADSFDEFRATGARQWIRRSLRDFMAPFSALDAHEAVALIDGASKPVSTRPQANAQARISAGRALGATRYEELRAAGEQLPDELLVDRIRSEIELALHGPVPQNQEPDQLTTRGDAL